MDEYEIQIKLAIQRNQRKSFFTATEITDMIEKGITPSPLQPLINEYIKGIVDRIKEFENEEIK